MRGFHKILLLTCFFVSFSFCISQADESISNDSFLVKTADQDFHIDFGDCSKLEKILNVDPNGYFYSLYQIKSMIQLDENTIVAYSSIKLYIIKDGQVSTINLENTFSPYGIDIVKLYLLDNNLYISLYVTTEEKEGYILLSFNQLKSELESGVTSDELLENLIKNNFFYSYILFCNDTVYFFKESSKYIYLFEGLNKTFIGHMYKTYYFKCPLIESIDKLFNDILQLKTLDCKNYILDLNSGVLYFQSKC